MALYKRGRVWWMDFVYKGKCIRRSTETKNGKQAERIYHKVMAEVIEGKWFDRRQEEKITFAEMMEKYMTEHSARNKAQTSHIRDRSLADHLLKYFGELTLAEIMPKLISEYKTKRREEKAAPKTINNELILMGHAFKIAINEWEWVRDNPVRKVSKEKVNNQIERWLTFEEEKKLVAASPKWLQEIVTFAVETGLRLGEILNLRWPQVDLFRRTLSILEQKNKDTDTLPLNKTAMEILKARAKVRHIRSNYVFLNKVGGKINQRNVIRAFHSALKKSGVAPCRFHDLRHSFATRLVQAGKDIYTVQKLGRWKSISMVTRYAHHYPESLRSGVEALDSFRENHLTILSQSKEKGVTPDAQPLDLFGSGG
jgi:integrase